MANTKISALPTVTTVGSTDIVPLVQGGVTKSATAQQFLASVVGTNPVAGLATLKQLADAIGDDPTYAADMVTTLAAKQAGMTVTAVKTAAYTAGLNEVIPVDATTGTVPITLPTTPADRTRVIVKKIDASLNTVTIAAGGTAVFNKAGGSTTATLSLLNQSTTLQYAAASGIWYVVAADTPLSQTDGRYVKTLGASNGTDDTTWLNAAIAGGGRFVGNPGTTYLLSAPLYVDSNTDLDLPAVTLLTGSKTNIIRNRAVVNARTASDAAYTAASATLTSATAAFVAGDVGKPLRRYYNDGTWDDTTIASVTNGTTAVAASNATQTVTGAGATIGTRDSNINIKIGRLTRTAANGVSGGADDGNGLHSIFLRRVDRWTLEVAAFTSSDGKYGASLADTTSFDVRRFGITSSASDGVHLLGHCYDFRISRVAGAVGDDLTAITTVDYSQYADVKGPVSDGTFTDCEITALANGGATPHAVALYGDLSGVYPIRNIRVSRCVDKSIAQRSVLVMDYLSNVTVEDSPGQTVFTATTATTTQTGLQVRGARLDFATGGPAAPVFITNVTIPDGLTIEGVSVGGATGLAHAVLIGPSSVVASVSVRGARHVRNSGHLVYVYGTGTTVTHLAVANGYRDGIDYSTGRLVSVDTSATLKELSITGTYAKRCQFAIAVAQSTALSVNTSASTFEGVLDVRADTCNMVVRGGGNNWSGSGVQVANGGTVHSVGDFLVDVSKLAKSVGDTAYNTSNANTGTLGVGPAVCTSSGTAPNWKSLVSGNTF